MCIYGIATVFWGKSRFDYSGCYCLTIKNDEYLESLKTLPTDEYNFYSTGFDCGAHSLFECKKLINEQIKKANIKFGYVTLYLLKLPPHDNGCCSDMFCNTPTSRYTVINGKLKKNQTEFDLLKEPMSNYENCETFLEFRSKDMYINTEDYKRMQAKIKAREEIKTLLAQKEAKEALLAKEKRALVPILQPKPAFIQPPNRCSYANIIYN